MKRSALILSISVLSILGLADAAYLANAALTDTPLTCTIEGLSGCNIVAQSRYSHFLGMPLGVYGVVFYAVVLLVVLAAAKRGSRGLDRVLALLAGIGALASIGFLYIQLALIQAVCVYCLGSAAISFLLLLPAYMLVRQGRAAPEPPASA